MQEKEIRQWIYLLGETAQTETGVTWVHMTCPLAQWDHQSGKDSNPSHGVHVSHGESRLHCWSCNFSGTQMDLLLRLQREGVQLPYGKLISMINDAEENTPFGWEDGAYEDSLNPAPDHVYPDFFLDITEPAYSDGQVHPYLAQRQVSYETAEVWDIRWDPFRQRVAVPVRDFEGRLRGLHGRAVNPAANLKYLAYPHEHKTNPHIFLGEHLVDAEQTIVLPESMFDLFRVYEVYKNVMTPLKAGMSKSMIARLENAQRILTMFDGDKAGELAREKLTEQLPKTVELMHCILPEGKDAGDLTLEEVAQALAPALGQ